jgi:hypothetical protein
MFGGVVGNTYRVWVTVEDKGNLKTGLVPGDFTATIVPFNDSASTTASVAESTQKPGLYFFDIPGAFLTTHGAGNYAVVIEANATGPKFDAAAGRPLQVTRADIEKIAEILALDKDNPLHVLKDKTRVHTGPAGSPSIDQIITEDATEIVVTRQ